MRLPPRKELTMKFEYQAQELSASKYVSGQYCLKKVFESGEWAMFSSYVEDGVRSFYVVDVDWGAGNINDPDIFASRVQEQIWEMNAMEAYAKKEFGF